MSGLYGADITQLRELAQRFDRASQDLARIDSDVSATAGLRQNWRGADAEAFRGAWTSGTSVLLRNVAASLLLASGALTRNAADQETTSAVDGGATGGPGGPSSGGPGSGGGAAPSAVPTSAPEPVTPPAGRPDPDAPAIGEAPKDTKGLLNGVQQNGDGIKDGLRIQAVRMPDGSLGYIVSINGTDSGSGGLTGANDNAAVFGIPTMTGDYIAEQMRAAGITADDDVLIVGYSQGGIHAQNIAASGEFGNPTVVTQGSPEIAGPIPGIDILRIESDDDHVVNTLNPNAGPNDFGRWVNGATGFDPYADGGSDATYRFDGGEHTDHKAYANGADGFDASNDPQYDPIKGKLGDFLGADVLTDSDVSPK